MPKTKQQEAQEKRLQANIQQARKNRSAVKKAGKKSGPHAKPPGKGGFFSGVKRDAPQTAQQTIPYREIYKDGICRVNDKLYTKTIQFFDINYQLAQADDKAQIFENYCDFLNYFDSTISVQLTFINQRANMQDLSLIHISKKYRKDVEYGSARWGTKADIAPFMDPKPENNIILTQTEGLMMSGRPKNPAFARNKNVLVVGGSGSGGLTGNA